MASGKDIVLTAFKSGLGAQAALTALVALLLLSVPGTPPPLYVSLGGFAMAGLLLAARRLSAFLKVFVSVYGIGYLVLALAKQAALLALLPAPVADLLPPDFAATGAVVFAGIVLAMSCLAPIRAITRIADPYFESRDAPIREIGMFRFLGRAEGEIGRRLVALSIFITFAQVALQLRLNFWHRDLFNALQEQQADVFWYQLVGVFLPLATLWVILGMLDVFVDASLQIRWRTWLTRSLYERWLAGGAHYRIPYTGEDADNPDQRIQSDVNMFIKQTMMLSIRLLSQAATLVSFMIILWGLSRDFVLSLFGTVVPGFLVWFVIGYAVVGTWLAHIIGRPLIGLDFQQERAEADFRFSLARSRIYSEQIALLRGERAETIQLSSLFSSIVENYVSIIYRRLKLGGFTFSYTQLSVVFPYILAAPAYFAKAITLGQFRQTGDAFTGVQSSLSFFIQSYDVIAAYKANTDRLASFDHAMTRAESLGTGGHGLVYGNDTRDDVTVRDLVLSLPDGREIVRIGSLTLPKGRATLVTGPSGSGKSTLFRAMAGIWPFGQGRIDVPPDQSAMLLPQRPYLPLGSLRSAVVYPNTAGRFSDAAIREVLVATQLFHLADCLDEVDAWDRCLSGGEQQRLAMARAILAKPAWLFLDEATAALDEPSEAHLYEMLRARLPETTIVSIGHRSTLLRHHDHRIDLTPSASRRFSIRDRGTPLPASSS